MKLFGRIAIVFAAAIGIWLSMIHFQEISAGAEYSPLIHFISAVFIFGSAVLLVVLARRFLDRRSLNEEQFLWKRLGWHRLLLGMACWAVPAAIGLFISIALGWTQIALQSPIGDVVSKAVFLLVVVFLIEAFPEELIVRGYIYTHLNTVFPHWSALLIQTVLFTLFAFIVGALYSPEQIWFIPGFAFLMGYFRALTGDIWFSIGFHLALMTSTQLLSPVHHHFTVGGEFVALHFFSFILLPSVVSALVLNLVYGRLNWDARHPHRDA